jgi:hypothetical protein
MNSSSKSLKQTANFLPFEGCGLCKKKVPLCESHILPKFLGREMKRITSSKTIVDPLKPSKSKAQDLVKVKLLCSDCEGLFSKWEDQFRRNFIKNQIAPVEYEDWLLKFAVSVSWRVLTYLKYVEDDGKFDNTTKISKFYETPLESEFHQDADDALETWRQFLLRERGNIGHFHQHFLIMSGKNFPHEHNNAVGFTMFKDGELIVTNAFLFQFIILGLIKTSGKYTWKNTEIDSTKGWVGITQSIPKEYFDWLASHAKYIEEASTADWERQKVREKKQ